MKNLFAFLLILQVLAGPPETSQDSATTQDSSTVSTTNATTSCTTGLNKDAATSCATIKIANDDAKSLEITHNVVSLKTTQSEDKVRLHDVDEDCIGEEISLKEKKGLTENIEKKTETSSIEQTQEEFFYFYNKPKDNTCPDMRKTSQFFNDFEPELANFFYRIFSHIAQHRSYTHMKAISHFFNDFEPELANFLDYNSIDENNYDYSSHYTYSSGDCDIQYHEYDYDECGDDYDRITTDYYSIFYCELNGKRYYLDRKDDFNYFKSQTDKINTMFLLSEFCETRHSIIKEQHDEFFMLFIKKLQLSFHGKTVELPRFKFGREFESVFFLLINNPEIEMQKPKKIEEHDEYEYEFYIDFYNFREAFYNFRFLDRFTIKNYNKQTSSLLFNRFCFYQKNHYIIDLLLNAYNLSEVFKNKNIDEFNRLHRKLCESLNNIISKNKLFNMNYNENSIYRCTTRTYIQELTNCGYCYTPFWIINDWIKLAKKS